MSDEQRLIITSRSLGISVRYPGDECGDRRLVLLLLKHGAEPNHISGLVSFSIWDQLLLSAVENPKCKTKTNHAIIQDFIDSGAELRSTELPRYLEDTRYDTTSIRAKLKKEKKERAKKYRQQILSFSWSKNKTTKT